MLTSLLLAYIITGMIKITDLMRRDQYLTLVYRSFTFPAFLASYTVAVLLWLPVMVFVALTKKKGK